MTFSKWRPAAPLNWPNDMCHVPVKMTTLILGRFYTRFYPRFSNLHQMTPFFENLNIKLKFRRASRAFSTHFDNFMTISHFWDIKASFGSAHTD